MKKKVTLTQIYELSVSYTVDVDADESIPDIIDKYGEYEINVLVTPLEVERNGVPMDFECVDSLTIISTFVEGDTK